MSATAEETATGYRYVVKTAGIKGGNACVEGTRICVHTIVFCMLRGDSLDEIVRSYPLVTRAQVYECMAYYEDNKPEIDALMKLHAGPPTEEDLKLMAAIRERNLARTTAGDRVE